MKSVILGLAVVVASSWVAAASAADRPFNRNVPQARAACNNNAYGTNGLGVQYQYYPSTYGYGNYNYYNYPSYGGYGGYGNGYVNYGYPGAVFVSPAAFGYGPGAIFGW